jgi:hypothetical protein
MNFEFVSEFEKDVKRLAKKWRSIPSDIEAAKKYITPLYIQLSDDVDVDQYRQEFFARKRAAVLTSKGDGEVVKMRLDVESLGTNSKVRIVFVAIVAEDTVKFIELYAKNDKEREDTARVKKYT